MQRIAVLVDRISLITKLKKNNYLEENENFFPISVYKELNNNIMNYLKHELHYEKIRHQGTWIFVPKRVDLFDASDESERNEEKVFLEHMKKVDSIFGYIIKYGVSYKNKSTISKKGIDTNLVCQMLLGAFEDEYDICILISDIDEFIPAM
jgi:hypothetical protein